MNRTKWGRQIGGGVFEFRLVMTGKEVVNLEGEINDVSHDEARRRFDLNPSEDLLLCVVCATQGRKVILLLHGYDKAKDASKRRQQAR